MLSSHVAAAVAGAQATKVAARVPRGQSARHVEPEAPRRGEDELDLELDGVQAAEAVRNLKGNDQEEAAEDHRQHGQYFVTRPGPAEPGSLDVEA